MKHFIIIILFIIINFYIFGNDTIYKVVDKQTQEELVGVKIVTETDTIWSNFEGEFRLTKIDEDGITIKLSYISYYFLDTIIFKNDSIIGLEIQ
jgi:hypothetical protein